jgi:hypothetical protein
MPLLPTLCHACDLDELLLGAQIPDYGNIDRGLAEEIRAFVDERLGGRHRVENGLVGDRPATEQRFGDDAKLVITDALNAHYPVYAAIGQHFVKQNCYASRAIGPASADEWANQLRSAHILLYPTYEVGFGDG